MLPGTPKPGRSAGASRVASPDYFGQGNGISAQGGVSRANPGIKIGMGTMSPQQQPQQAQQQPGASTAVTNQAQGKDPFADLVGLF